MSYPTINELSLKARKSWCIFTYISPFCFGSMRRSYSYLRKKFHAFKFFKIYFDNPKFSKINRLGEKLLPQQKKQTWRKHCNIGRVMLVFSCFSLFTVKILIQKTVKLKPFPDKHGPHLIFCSESHFFCESTHNFKWIVQWNGYSPGPIALPSIMTENA